MLFSAYFLKDNSIYVKAKKILINEFKNQVSQKLQENIGTGRVSYEQFTNKFSKVVLKKGLKELEQKGFKLETTKNNNTQFITRR